MLITLDRSDTPCAHMMLIFVHRDDDIIMILLKHSLLWCILALSMVVYLHSLWLCTCTLYGGVLALYGGVLHSLWWCTCILYCGALALYVVSVVSLAYLGCSAPLAYLSDVF